MNQDYKVEKIETLIQHPDNPRKGSVAEIKALIETNGWHGAVIAQRSTRRILAGNHRWLAAKSVGMDQIPVIWVDVDDATATRILLADNRASDMGTYDDGQLLALLKSVPDLAGTGYDQIDLDLLIDRMELPAPIEAPHTVGGEPGGTVGTGTLLQWGFVQWKQRRVQISADEVKALDALLDAYLEDNGGVDAGFGFHLVDDRVEAEAATADA